MEQQQTDLLDVVIIGAAAVGCAAAVYAARRHLRGVIVAKDIGGEVALSGEVENWPGTQHTTGIELSRAFHEHVKSYDFPIEDGIEVTSISQEGNIHLVSAKNYSGEEKVYRTKTVLIGSGIHPRSLGVPREAELKGRGVTYCTVCDGPLFKGKTTITIGAGSSALESALMMSDIADTVYLVTKYDESNNGGFPKGESILIKKLKAKENVTIIYNALTTEIRGEEIVAGITYKDTASDETHTIDANAVMVHIGAVPNSNFVDCVEKNAGGEILTDKLGLTNCPGIFAAGDVTDVPYKQIAIAAGQGVTAMLSAIDYINKWE